MAGTVQVNKGSGIVLPYSGPNTGMFYTPLKLDRNSLKLNPYGMSWTEYQPDGFQFRWPPRSWSAPLRKLGRRPNSLPQRISRRTSSL